MKSLILALFACLALAIPANAQCLTSSFVGVSAPQVLVPVAPVVAVGVPAFAVSPFVGVGFHSVGVGFHSGVAVGVGGFGGPHVAVGVGGGIGGIGGFGHRVEVRNGLFGSRVIVR